jgi:OOP family OmpA-OmpF porin
MNLFSTAFSPTARRWLATGWALLWSMVPIQAQPSDKQSDKARLLYNQANAAFAERKFDKGMDLLKKAIEKDPAYAEAYFRMAAIYHDQLRDREAAIPLFEKALSLKPGFPPFINAYQIVGNHALQQGNYDKTRSMIETFLALNPPKEVQIREAKRILATCDFAKEAMQHPLDFHPKPMSATVNQMVLQYFPVLTADQQVLIFTGRQGLDIQQDENLYFSVRKGNDWTPPRSISPQINTAFNEGTCSISADGRTMVFTCCQGRQSYGSCDLYITYNQGGVWTEPENMGPKINTMAWESQPSLSADGRRIYFCSDRRGGRGKRDIWVSELDEEGYWQSPINLGAGVNTPYDDLSPFIHANGRLLYFSSDGHTGLGGFDLFSTEWLGQNRWTAPQNLGYPVNDHLDQVSLFVSSDGKKAYYSYEQMEGKLRTHSKLYEFDIPAPIRPRYSSDFLKGTVYDAKTKEKLEAKIELFDVRKDSLVALMKSDPKTGAYLTVLTQGDEYALYINKTGYLFKSLYFDFSRRKPGEPLVIDIYLKPVEKGATEVLNNLFFATNEYKLDNKSLTEIHKLYRFMQEYPNSVVEIAGHTDDVDTHEYNQELSLKRAREVHRYLIEAGISNLRLRYAGYGETQPAVPNTSDKNRALNRRIEFKILGF